MSVGPNHVALPWLKHLMAQKKIKYHTPRGAPMSDFTQGLTNSLRKAKLDGFREGQESFLGKSGSRGGYNEAERVEACLRGALAQEVETVQAELEVAVEMLARAEALNFAQGKDISALEADVNGMHQKLAAAERHNARLLTEIEEGHDKIESFAEADTVSYELSGKDRLELEHLEHRHNLLAERVEARIAPALRDAAIANHRSRWLLGFVFLLVSAAMLTWATYFGVAS